MSKNKKAKEELIRRYGAECFIEKLHLRNDLGSKRYTGKQQRAKMKQLTYHHIKMRKDGGPATVENGALLSEENHRWFHQQPPEVQQRLNEIFQEYKKQFDLLNGDDEQIIERIKLMELTFDQFIGKAKKHYNRAKERREFEKRIKDEYKER